MEWEGPISLEEARTKQGETDWGVYQIYGYHPVYGSDVLLYIGKAERQFFGVRLAQEKWWDVGADPKRITVYLGRLAGEMAPDNDTWCRMIDLAERLLIFAHKPAWNAQKNIGGMDADLQGVHIMNWGYHRSLSPEISGARWTSRLNSMTQWHVFDGREPRIPKP